MREKASQNAISNERRRIREIEKDEHIREVNGEFTIDDVKLLLKKERNKCAQLLGEIAAMKSMAVASQAEAEVCEEGRINGLMRRLDLLQKEKGRIIVELEREEEMLTNTLQKKLNEVRREKAELEKQIEREHTFNLELKAKLDAKLTTMTSTRTTRTTTPSAAVTTATDAAARSATNTHLGLRMDDDNSRSHSIRSSTNTALSIDSMPSLKNDVNVMQEGDD